MAEFLDRLALLLNPTRMRYPYFIGAAVWIGWISSILLGSGNTDAAGHLLGTDFVAFYTAGKILLLEKSADLYDLELAHQIQQPLYGAPNENFNPYLNPPFYAWIFVPFARLSYPLSPILWMGLSLGMLWISIKLFNPDFGLPLFLLILTWQPAFAAISFGQNAFLSLLILSLTYTFWHKEKHGVAGLICGLLLYKPQLLMGVGLLWLLDFPKSWRALTGLAITSATLLSTSLLLMPQATYQYFFYTQKVASNLMKIEGFPIWNAHSVQSFWLGLFPNSAALAQILYLLCALAGVLFFIFFLRSTANKNLRYGAAICLTMWITPYIMIYDWVLLVIPGILFWQECVLQRTRLKVIYGFLWVVMFISSALTFGQWSLIEHAIQFSVPALLLVFFILYRAILPNQIKTIPQPVD